MAVKAGFWVIGIERHLKWSVFGEPWRSHAESTRHVWLAHRWLGGLEQRFRQRIRSCLGTTRYPLTRWGCDEIGILLLYILYCWFLHFPTRAPAWPSSTAVNLSHQNNVLKYGSRALHSLHHSSISRRDECQTLCNLCFFEREWQPFRCRYHLSSVKFAQNTMLFIQDPRACDGNSFYDRLNCSFTVYLLVIFSLWRRGKHTFGVNTGWHPAP